MPPLAKRDLDMICNATQDAWSALRDQQLFLSGGTGFFGRWLLESLLAANDRFALNATATVLTRSPAAFHADCPRLAAHPAVTLLTGDVQTFTFPRSEFAFVIHAAADVAAARNGAPRAATNLLTATFDGTRRMLDFAVSHGTRRFLMVSSGAVYGPQPPELSHIPESYCGAPDPCLSLSAYGEGKRAAEALCSAYSASEGLACVIARPFAFVGAHLRLDQGFAIADFIRSALKGEPIEIRGDPGTLRSYLYAADLAVWLWTILLRAAPLTPYNVGSDQAITIAGLAEEVVSNLSPGLPIHERGKPLAPSEALNGALKTARSQYVPSTQRCARDLGLRQTVSLADAIRRTAAWHGWLPSGSAQQERRSL